MLVFTVSHRPVLSVRVRSTFVLKAFDYFKWPLNILRNFAHLTLINCQTAHGKSFLAHTLNPRACLKLTCIFFLIVSKGNDKVCKRKNSNLSDITIIIYFWHINAVWQIGYFSFLGDPEGDDLTWIAGLVYGKMAYSRSVYSSPNQFLKHQDSLFWLACSRLWDGRVSKIEKALTRK